METNMIIETRIGSDSGTIDTILSVLAKEAGTINNDKPIRRWLEEIEFNEDGTVDYKQDGIKKIADWLGNKNAANTANWIADGIKSSSLMEAVTKIKRRHTEDHPAIYINPEAKMRNKIVEFIGGHDKCRCTTSELKEFMNGLKEDEEIGKAPNKNYVTSNKNLFSKVKVGKNECIKLTGIGRRVYNHLMEKAEKDMNEGIKNQDEAEGLLKDSADFGAAMRAMRKRKDDPNDDSLEKLLKDRNDVGAFMNAVNEAKDLSKYRGVDDVLKAVGITGKDADEIAEMDRNEATDQELFDRIKKATDIKTAKNLMGWWGAEVDDLAEVAQRQDIKIYNGEKYEIWHDVPKGYYAKGLDSMDNQITKEYFDKQDGAEKHAEKEIDGFLNEQLIMEYTEVDSEEMDRIREIRGSLEGKGSVDFPSYKKEELKEFARIVKELNADTGIEAKLGLSQRGELIVGFKNEVEEEAGMGYMEKFGEAVNSSELLGCPHYEEGEEVEESKKYTTNLIYEAMNMEEFSALIITLNAGWDYDGDVSEDEDGRFTVTFADDIPPEVLDAYKDDILVADPELVFLSTDGSVAKFEAPINIPETDLDKEIEGIPDDPKKNKRIGGIEFHPPIHNKPDAPTDAQDQPAGTSESVISDIKGLLDDDSAKISKTMGAGGYFAKDNKKKEHGSSNGTPKGSYKIVLSSDIDDKTLAKIAKGLVSNSKFKDWGYTTGVNGKLVANSITLLEEEDEEKEKEDLVVIDSSAYEESKGYYGKVINEGVAKNQVEIYNKFNHKVYTGWFDKNQILEAVDTKETDAFWKKNYNKLISYVDNNDMYDEFESLGMKGEEIEAEMDGTSKHQAISLMHTYATKKNGLKDLQSLIESLSANEASIKYKNKFTKIANDLKLRIQSEPLRMVWDEDSKKEVELEVKKDGSMYLIHKDGKEIATLSGDMVYTDMEIDDLQSMMMESINEGV